MEFERATTGDAAAKLEAAQKAAQHAHAGHRRESQSWTSARKKTPEIPGSANLCDTIQRIRSEAARIELPTKSTENIAIATQSGAESGAIGAREAPVGPGLAAVEDAWPTLPAAVRQRIVALIREKTND
jgi:hypothetical protein